jgi:hypothetical protein
MGVEQISEAVSEVAITAGVLNGLLGEILGDLGDQCIETRLHAAHSLAAQIGAMSDLLLGRMGQGQHLGGPEHWLMPAYAAANKGGSK